MKNGWQVAIDMFYFGQDEENHNVLNSHIYETEQEADAWYRSLDFSETEYADNLDIIMIHWVNGQIENTYIL